MPVFGMYFPKAEEMATRTRSTDNAALIIFVGLLEERERGNKSEKCGRNLNILHLEKKEGWCPLVFKDHFVMQHELLTGI